MNLLKRITLLFVLMGLASPLLAQRSYKYWTVGVSAGTMYYQGDLDDHGFQPWIGLQSERDASWGSPLQLMKPAFGIQGNYHFHPHMFLRLGGMFGWIGAADSLARDEGSNNARRFRNLDFRNRIVEFSATINYHFFANDRHYRFRPNWNPFIFAGVGVFYHNPYTTLGDDEIAFYSQQTGHDFSQYEGENIYLQQLRTEGQGTEGCENCEDPYSLVQLSIPIGFGITRRLTDRLDLSFRAGVRKTFTDHLDDVGNVYYSNPESYIDGGAPTDNPFLSYVLSDRSNYRPTTTGYEVQTVYEQITGTSIEGDVGTGGEKRGFPAQDDWFAYTGFTLNYILDSGPRCPKFK